MEACNLTLNYEGSRDINTLLPTRVDGGAPPDIADLANPGALETYADNLVALAMWASMPTTTCRAGKTWGASNDKWVGLPVKTDIKSLVWYSPVAFDTAGYNVPTTWDEFVALMDKMVSDGGPAPLSMGFEAAARPVGRRPISSRTSCCAPRVRNMCMAWTRAIPRGQIRAWWIPGRPMWTWVNKYAAGGSDGALTTAFGDAILLPFQDPAGAWMVKQSGFAGTAFIRPNFPDYVYGEDFAFFVLPTLDGNPVPMQVGGDFMVAFNDTPAVQAVMAYLSSADGANAWAAASFDLTPNGAVDPWPTPTRFRWTKRRRWRMPRT